METALVTKLLHIEPCH